MTTAHVVWSLIVGLFVGWFARALMPGPNHMGMIVTSLLGVAGSLVGGFIGTLVSRPRDGASFHPAGFIMSVIGSLVLLFLWNRVG